MGEGSVVTNLLLAPLSWSTFVEPFKKINVGLLEDICYWCKATNGQQTYMAETEYA